MAETVMLAPSTYTVRLIAGYMKVHGSDITDGKKILRFES